jgi:hypothetical protein
LKNKNTLFVGASPLLETQMDWIYKNKKFLYILCSDTASNSLIQNQIIPDAVISVDSGRGTIYHLNKLPEHIPILTWLGGASEIFYKNNPIHIFFTNYPLDQILCNILFQSHELILENPSLNIAGLAKSFCIQYQSDLLLLAGISFKMNLGKTHTRGTGYENYFIDKTNRKVSLESYIPNTYKQVISKKNEIALYHLTDSSQIKIKSVSLTENFSESIIKENLLSIRISEKEKKEFYKSIRKEEIMNALKKSLSVSKNRILRFI